MKKPKAKRKNFGAVRKPSGRVVIEGVTPWHIDRLQFFLCLYSVGIYEKKEATIADKSLAWVANELLEKKVADARRKTLPVKPHEMGVLVLAIALAKDIDLLNLKGHLHRLL
jgi:hypothetical protein